MNQLGKYLLAFGLCGGLAWSGATATFAKESSAFYLENEKVTDPVVVNVTNKTSVDPIIKKANVGKEAEETTEEESENESSSWIGIGIGIIAIAIIGIAPFILKKNKNKKKQKNKSKKK